MTSTVTRPVRRAEPTPRRWPGPLRPPRPTARDLALTAGVAALSAVLGVLEVDGDRITALGWLLLALSVLPLAWRRHAPLTVFALNVAAVGPLHTMDFTHPSTVVSSVVALYTVAVVGPPLRTALVTLAVIGLIGVVMLASGSHAAMDVLGPAGWLVAVVVLGEAVRVHRDYVAAIVERADRAERTREEEAARRVAEERLRIARDLHDLLAHSITLIGVQTSIASHVLIADPERLDREAVAKALDGIADTCREARAELRTTLQVLRDGDPAGSGPLPGLSGLRGLAEVAEAGGATVRLRRGVGTGRPGAEGDAGEPAVPAAVGAAAYRIVQEALTNAVRHAGPAPRIEVVVERADEVLRVRVADDGPQPPGADGAPEPATADGAPGHGIVGMRERARSVGGTLWAGPRPDGPGFVVAAELPTGTPPAEPASDEWKEAQR